MNKILKYIFGLVLISNFAFGTVFTNNAINIYTGTNIFNNVNIKTNLQSSTFSSCYLGLLDNSTLSANSDIRLWTGGNVQSVIIKNTGNVGIGTNTPTERLHIVGNTLVESNLNVKGTINGYTSRQLSNSVVSYNIQTNVYAQTKDPTGWEGDTDNNRTYLFDTNSRVLTITNSIDMVALLDGQEFIKTNKITFSAINTNAGLWYFYYDHDTRSQVVSQTAWTLDDIMVATVYWGGGSNNTIALIGEETHGFMPWTTHRRWHETDGSRYANGLDLVATNPYIFNINSGVWYDEDIRHSESAISTSRTMYRSSNLTSPIYTTIGSRYTITNGASQGLMYDNNGTLTQVGTIAGGSYVNYWLYISPLSDAPYIWVAGRTNSTTLSVLTTENPYNLTGLLPTAEYVLLYRVTLRNSNPPVVTSISDVRTEGFTAATYAPTQHSALSGRDAADSHPLSAITGYENILTNGHTSAVGLSNNVAIAGTLSVGTNVSRSTYSTTLKGHLALVDAIASYINSDNSLFIYPNGANKDVHLYSSGSGRLLLNGTGGNVGINTNTPSERLHVNGNAKIEGTLSATSLTGITNVTVSGKVYIGPNIGGNTAYLTSDGTNLWFVNVNSISKQLAP